MSAMSTPWDGHPAAIAGRLVAMRFALEAQRLDALLVTDLTNIRYLTGFTGTAGCLIVARDGATLFVDGRYSEQAEQQFTRGAVQITPRDILGGALAALQNTPSIRRLGFEPARLTYDQWARLTRRLERIEAVPSIDVVERLRGRKDAAEIAAIRRAIEITDLAYEDALTWITPGLLEAEVAARIEYFQRARGAERKESLTAVGSGPRSAQPHCIATGRRIGADEAVMLDIGCTVDGYNSDLTRTVFLGDPPEEFRTIYRIVGEAQTAAIEAIKPGRAGKEIHTAAHDYITRHGYGQWFPHGLGHSLGLNIHEGPRFSAGETATIEPGNVITVEPGIYLPGRFGVRTEDVILVTKDGCEVLSRADKTLTAL